jgi:hypothetical protein
MKPTTAALSLLILVIVVGLFLSYLYAISPKPAGNGVFVGNKAGNVKNVEAVKDIAPATTTEQIEDEAKTELLERIKNLERINVTGTTSPEVAEKILSIEEKAKAKAELLDRIQGLENMKIAPSTEK